MERRDFIKKTCNSCASVGIGLLLSSAIMESCKTSSLSVYKVDAHDGIVAIPLASLTESNAKLVRINNYNFDIAVIKQPSGEYLALLLMCTHAGQALTKAGSNYLCPLHGSIFSAAGNVVKGPATDPLEHLVIKTDKQNLFIKLDAAYYTS